MTDDDYFDANEALNRVVASITPFRQSVSRGEGDPGELTEDALAAAYAAIGRPLTTPVAMSMLIAAVIRIADFWLEEEAPANE